LNKRKKKKTNNKTNNKIYNDFRVMKMVKWLNISCTILNDIRKKKKLNNFLLYYRYIMIYIYRERKKEYPLKSNG